MTSVIDMIKDCGISDDKLLQVSRRITCMSRIFPRETKFRDKYTAGEITKDIFDIEISNLEHEIKVMEISYYEIVPKDYIFDWSCVFTVAAYCEGLYTEEECRNNIEVLTTHNAYMKEKRRELGNVDNMWDGWLATKIMVGGLILVSILWFLGIV